MTEKIFESAFHKRYVGGAGDVVVKQVTNEPVKKRTRETTEEEVLSEYRRYIGDPSAELPEAVRKTLLLIQRTENDGET
jgi:hypothetical protein